jgi:exodeoxyribonuclease-3
MRFATWNVNGLRARQAFILHWLAERQPDLVGLQELKLTDEEFPHEVFAEAGYRAVTHGQKAWNGIAILSRKPVRVTQIGLPGQEALGARLLCADLEDLSFISVYIPNGKDVMHEDFPRKLAWLDTLMGYLETRINLDRETILCGDFNICPSAIDSWNEEAFQGQIFHTDAERLRFQRLLNLGFADIYRELFSDGHAFSWWDYRGGAFHRKQGLRIDFLLATPGLMRRVRSVEIDREFRKKKAGLTPSDHAPVFADLVWHTS